MARSELPFTRKNWILFAIGIGVIILGYVLLRIPPADGFVSLTLAPILLVAGYCVIVPAAILVRESGGHPASTPGDTGTADTARD